MHINLLLSFALTLFPAMPQQPAQKPAPMAKSPPARVDVLGDPLPEGALLRLGTARFKHPNSAGALALSPDGKVVVTIGDHWLIAWEADTGKEIWRQPEAARYQFSGNYAAERPLAISADGKYLVTPGHVDAFAVWDIRTGRHRLVSFGVPRALPARQAGAMSNVRAVDIAPDGKSVAIGCPEGVLLAAMDGTTRKWVLNSGSGKRDAQDRLLSHGDYSFARFSPNGKTLAVVTSDMPKSLRLCDANDLTERKRIDLTAYLVQMAFSPDGKKIAVTERDNAVRVYDAQSGKRLHSWVVKLTNPYENYTSAVEFSPDGKLVAAGATDHVIYLWDTTTGKEVGQLKGTGWYPWGLAFSHDGNVLFSTGWDGVVRRWDIATRKQLPLPQNAVRCSAVVAASPDGRTLAHEDDAGAVHLVDAKTGREQKQLSTENGSASRLAFSRDSRFLAVGGSDAGQVHVILWNVADAKVVRRWDWPKGRDPHSTVEDIVFSPDGKQIAAAVFRQSEAHVFKVVGDKRLQMKHPSVYGLDFAPDGTTLATVGWDKTIRLWNPATGELRNQTTVESRQFRDPRMYGVRYSPDGRSFATADMSAQVLVWDATQLTIMQRIPIQGYFIFGALAYSPDGLRLATGDRTGRIRVWDAHSGAKLWERGDHGGYVYSLSFGLDRRTLLAGGNGIGYLWDLRPKDVPKKPVEQFWNDLTGDDSIVADRAFWALLDSPDESVKMLSKKVRVTRGEIVDAKRVADLIGELDAQKFATRERAQSELAKLGKNAWPHLKKALAAGGSLEQRRRLLKLLEPLFDDTYRLRNQRIVAVVRHLEIASAKELLQKWARIDVGSLGELAGAALQTSGPK